MNPLTNEVSGVTHTDASIYAYPDGSFEIDTGDQVFRYNANTTSKHFADYHKYLFNAEDEA